MAKAPASFPVFLCLLLLFTSSSARTPLEEIDDTNHDLFSGSDKNPDAANAILLPSDKGESEPATLIHGESQTADSKISTQVPDPVPFTLISFRPINRPLPSSLRLRHRCRHNHQFKPLNPRLPRREIPYAEDMSLNTVEDRNFDPARWMRFRHVEPRLSHDPSMEKSEEMRSPLHHPVDKGLMKRIRKFLNHF